MRLRLLLPAIALVIVGMFAILRHAAARYGLEVLLPLMPAVVIPGGILLAWLIVNAAPESIRAMKRIGWAKLQGRYYEFDGRPMRVIAMRERLWLHADDVRDALSIPRERRWHDLSSEEYAPVLPDAEVYGAPAGSDAWAVSLAGLHKLTAKITGHRTARVAARLVHWFDREVTVPWQRAQQL